eukprot:TRINITY_DN7660_c0_g1_i2.p1 TRINITY_DN7660_c0_g1~~TRINITY_DN7660_c0_g1_i2.p1  ORF type:complete len:108 (-),score=2.25 TRINITY_DN7660_c0_g1_i2:84-407(-)
MRSFAFCILLVLVFAAVRAEIDLGRYKRAVFRACASCKLTKLPELEKFVVEELPLYGVSIELDGGDPSLFFYDAAGTEIERIKITKLSHSKIRSLLTERGFPPCTLR